MAMTPKDSAEYAIWIFLLHDVPLSTDKIRRSFETCLNAGSEVHKDIKALIDSGRVKSSLGFQLLMDSLEEQGLVTQQDGEWSAVPMEMALPRIRQKGLFAE
jgi:hypothetical protein